MAGFPSSTGNCKQSTSSKPALSICHLIDWKCTHIWKDLWKGKTWYFQLFHSKIWISLLNLNLGISCEIRLYLLGSTVYFFTSHHLSTWNYLDILKVNSFLVIPWSNSKEGGDWYSCSCYSILTDWFSASLVNSVLLNKQTEQVKIIFSLRGSSQRCLGVICTPEPPFLFDTFLCNFIPLRLRRRTPYQFLWLAYAKKYKP